MSMNNYLEQMAEKPSLILNIPQYNDAGELTGYEEQPICVSDESSRERHIMGPHMLSLKFKLPGHYNEPHGFPIGTYCVYQKQTYTLETPENITKIGNRQYEYELVMQSDQYKLGKFMVRNTIPGDTRLKFSYTARPHEFMQLLVDNMNARDPEEGWSFDEKNIVESSEKTVSFNHNTCLDALRMIAEAFGTEWEVAGKIILLRKMEYFKDNPLPLSYGCGNGFLSGLGRSEYSDVKPVERLFVQGGDRNIDASKYRREEATGQVGSRELLMPISTTIKYDGVYFEDEDGFDPDSPNVREYITDESGASVTRVSNASFKGLIESSLDLTGVYPMREGYVAKVIWVYNNKEYANYADAVAAGAEPHEIFCDFTDDGTNPDGSPNPVPNYNNYQIGGETMSVIPQTGMLTSREFDVIYKHPGRFQIVSQTIDGVDMPNEQYQPRVGDKYAIFNVMLPDEYIASAERNMLKQAVKHLYEYEMPRFTFKGTVDGNWARRNWVNVGGRLRLGGYIRFSDDQFIPEGMDIRITFLKESINDPHKPMVTLSNSAQTGSWHHNMQRQIDSEEVTSATQDRDVVRFAKRRFRDVQQTTEMLQNAMLNFSKGVNPITVQTMQLVAGDESLQFDYSAPRDELRFYPEDGILFVPSGRLTHKTLGVNFISSENAARNLWHWDMPEYVSAVLDDPDKSYYLYAKVDVILYEPTEPDRRFLLSENAIPMHTTHEDGEYLYLLVGILNSEWGGDRSFSTLYGYTEVLPGRITTDLIKSADGESYLDLANNTARLGNLDWSKTKNNQLTIKGAINAENAQLGGFQIDNEKFQSIAKTGSNPNILIDGVNGSLYASKAEISGKVSTNQLTATGGTMQNVSIASSATGKRIEIRSSDGTLRHFNADGNERVQINDGDIVDTSSNIVKSGTILIAGSRASGGQDRTSSLNAFALDFQRIAGGTTTARYTEEGILIQRGASIISLVAANLSSPAISVKLLGLPSTAQGLEPGSLWVDSNGHIRITGY